MRGKEELENPNSYKVVINHEEQYSIWPAERENPAGWKDIGVFGSKSECLLYINKVWTDMRPLSLRRKMEDLEKNKNKKTPSKPEPPATTPKESLVSHLSSDVHKVEIYKSGEINTKEKIENGYIHIKFTETRGGTVLGVKLDNKACNLNNVDFEKSSGSMHLEGSLTLDYAEVRCIVDIDVQTKKGTGQLRPADK